MPTNKNIQLSSSTLDQFHRSHTAEEYKAMMHEIFNIFGLQLTSSNDTQQDRDETSE